ncbi:hypothetical protein C8R46DRAFT_1273037 [Mycena filopes]|nr:hypothetical protein C8R46DRAFT_1273037 [Mycena filopes]
MPRVAQSTTRSHNLPTGGKLPPSPPLKFRCPEAGCPWSYSGSGDLNRHLPRHMSPEERESKMFKCPHTGCPRKFLQKSNMKTHYTSQHTGLKPHFCTECAYSSADPSCLHRHMRNLHAYVPGTQPRRKRSSTMLSLALFDAPSPDSSSSSASGSAWSVASSPAVSSTSPASSTYDAELLYSPSTSAYSPTSSMDSLPVSPDASAWAWDPSFEAACFAITASPSLEPQLLYPGEVFDEFIDMSTPSWSPSPDASLLFSLPSTLDFSLNLDLQPLDFSSLDYTLPGSESVFPEEWRAWGHNTTCIVDGLMQALSESTDIAFTALLVLHRARHHWFSNADLRPHIQRHSIVHHLGLLAQKFVRPTLLPDNTHELYLDIIQTIAAEPEWRSSLFPELPTWIEIFLLYHWDQQSHTSDAFILITRSVWAPNFDDKQWQLRDTRERCAACIFEALAYTWEIYDFTTSTALENFFPMARYTVVTVLYLQPYWNHHQEEFDYWPLLPPPLLPVVSSRLCKSLRQAATNSRNASRSESPGVVSSSSVSESTFHGIARFLEDMAQKLTTALQPDVAALNVLADSEETNGPWWKLRTDLLREITALGETIWVEAGHD